ncbi:hypothetical protein [Zavarzinella formosa]|uniref:hypothetical protein n=1 Tax=Zavarzinella formosa TaxID=360055 RepID=UPI0002E93260|nr:hypothetical protein [Zavarzinella formosa]
MALLDARPAVERPLTMRGLYAEAHAEQLVALEAVNRDIQAAEKPDAVARLRLEESRICFWLDSLKADSVADLCFGFRSSLLLADSTLPGVVMELLADRVATKADIEELRAGMRVLGRMLTGGQR